MNQLEKKYKVKHLPIEDPNYKAPQTLEELQKFYASYSEEEYLEICNGNNCIICFDFLKKMNKKNNLMKYLS